MTPLQKIGILGSWWLIGTVRKTAENNTALKEAKEYKKETGKPILNLGCMNTDFGDINADLIPRKAANFMLIDANKALPFPDKHFSSVCAFHIIEHLKDPEFSYKEMKRVADKVFLTFPDLWNLGCWLTPDHKYFIIKERGEPKFVKYTPAPALLLTTFWLIA